MLGYTDYLKIFIFFYPCAFVLPLKLNCSFPLCHSRMRTQPCGFMVRAPGQCLLSRLAHTMVSRGKISNMVDSDKASSLRSNLGPSVIRISTTHRQGYLWNISNKIQGMHPMHPLVAHKANPLSSPNRYGKTVTNHGHLLIFRGPVVSLEVANRRLMCGHNN